MAKPRSDFCVLIKLILIVLFVCTEPRRRRTRINKDLWVAKWALILQSVTRVYRQTPCYWWTVQMTTPHSDPIETDTRTVELIWHVIVFDTFTCTATKLFSAFWEVEETREETTVHIREKTVTWNTYSCLQPSSHARVQCSKTSWLLKHLWQCIVFPSRTPWNGVRGELHRCSEPIY